ncbi:hypothetical protein [Cellulomonas cellasea]|uniref:Uncharacterized protein n=1 Tax=Cellulomonas cellasea TaxID=43670 RepID=A0A4Y3KSQ6_9CELL|nr:hypothetical protein [Cellulomonas cellasea]GEA86235.1 hypothetical protein CCE01nite_01840 [Cellulomonas cellasea]
MPVIVIADRASVPDGLRAVAPDRRALVDAVAELPPQAPVVLVAVDAVGWAEARAARLLYGREDIGLLRLDLPPTAVFVVAAGLELLADENLGLVGAVVDASARVMRTYALVSSVGKLERPTPSFGQHVASLWPSTRFLVDLTAGTVTPARELPGLTGIAAVARSATTWRGFDESTLPENRIDLPSGLAAAPWRSARWVEVTAVDGWIDDIVATVTSPAHVRTLPTCRSCTRPGHGARCVFCQLPLDAPATSAVATPALTPGGHA